MAKRILTDSGFWLALFDGRDQHHEAAKALITEIEDERLMIPWAVLYEVFRTRFVRKPARVRELRRFLVRPNVMVMDEADYREQALQSVLGVNPQNLSLVDGILRAMLEDRTLKIESFITFNRSDFEDVCQPRNIQLIP